MAQHPRKPLEARLVARLAPLVLATACAGAGAGGAAGTSVTPTVRDGQFVPGAAPAAQYGAAEGHSCQMTGVLRYVLDDLAVAAQRAGSAVPEADGQVCAVAEAFLAWDAAAWGAPRQQIVAFTSHWFGLPASVQMPIVATFDSPDERIIAERIVQSAAGSAALNAIRPRIGIAVQRQRRGKDQLRKISVVVYDALVQLDPLPRRLEPGQKATLSGRLAGEATNPQVFVSDATGKLSAPEQPARDTFRAELACGDRPGRMLVEIRGDVEGSSGLAASFPVGCGQDLPSAIAIASEPWPTDRGAAEKMMLEGLNAERRAVGAPPLAWDDAVARVARSISEDLAARGGVPGGPNVIERLKAEGIASPLVLQSAAADRTFERAQERILTSPRDRAAVLEPDANLVGIGAVSRTDAEGRPIVYVTEVLVKELPPVDVAKVRQQLRDAVAQKRKDARTTALSPDATLDAVAQKYAEALAAAGGNLPKDKASALTSELNKGFRSVTMVSGAKQEPLDLAEEPQTTAPGKGLGVGVAQGPHPVLGRNAVYVVLMVGTPRR